MKSKSIVGILVLFSVLLALGCRNTASGFGKDVENAGEKIQEKVD
jgi:predicted small secreted protein